MSDITISMVSLFNKFEVMTLQFIEFLAHERYHLKFLHFEQYVYVKL
jgi:hypothetical protein